MFYNYKHYSILVLALGAFFTGFAQTNETSVDSIPAEEEKINIAFGTQAEREVTSAISTVKGSELRKTFVPNLANTLYGHLAGLTVMQQGNEPGLDSPRLLSRGLNTFGGAGTRPLVIVDGVESTFEHLTPYEIESINLLKDASATAIYGSRGANGVLLVTTKRGTEGPLEVKVSAQVGFQESSDLPDFLGSYDYARLYNEGLINDGQLPLYSNEDLEHFRTGDSPYLYPNVDWYDEILEPRTLISNYNLSLNGGDENVKYFASLNALTNGGLIKRTEELSDNSLDVRYDRYNIRANVDIQLTEGISSSLLLGGVIGEKATPASNNAGSIFNTLSSLPPNAFPIYNPDGSYGGTSVYSNPLGDILESGFFTSSSRTLQSSYRVDAALDFITPGLSIAPVISYHTDFTSFSNKTRNYERFQYIEDEFGEPQYTKFGRTTQLEGSEGQSNQWQSMTFQTFLDYSKEIGAYKLDAMLMFNYKNFTTDTSSDYYPSGGQVFPYEHVGMGGRFTNVFYNKFIAEFSFGYNGSDNFPPGNRYGFFPAGSLGWIVTEGGDELNFLKLRGSYGIVGNDNIGGERHMFEPNFPGQAGYYFGGSNGYRNGIARGRMFNPNFTWETDTKLNVGLETTFFNNFGLSLDYFQHERDDILVVAETEVPTFIGHEDPYLNAGTVHNRGLEAVLEFRSNEINEFQFFAKTNVSYSQNEIIYDSRVPAVEEYLYRTGQPINQPFVLESIGFFQSFDEIENSPDQVFGEVQPGDLKYKDQNNDGIIDESDNYPLGKSNVPELIVGLNSGFSFKGFYTDFLLQGVTGRSVNLGGRYYHAFQNNAQISEMALGRWRPDNAGDATYPRLSATNNENNFQPSTFWQRDGSFIKLRNLEVGYNLPTSISQKWGINDVHVYVNGTNLYSWDHLTYGDPESLSGYPPMRSLSLGTSLTF